MRRLLAGIVLCLLAVLSLTVTGGAKSKSLQIYFIDVEGGQSTLIVSPSGQSLLVDTGWPGGRDADRIVTAAKAAGLRQIDYVLITHYHRDHVGGVPDLVKRFKVGTFVDHGPNQEDTKDPREDYAAYEKVIADYKHLSLKPGDGLPMKGIEVHVLTAAGEHIDSPLPGAGEANPYCADEPTPAADTSENLRSLGILVRYGNFKFVDLGDLTKDKERELMCPNNMIGTVDLFLVSHHGFNQSDSKALVWALHPRVAIVDNGPHKGGSPDVWQTVHDSPGLEGFWQIDYAVDAGKEHNVAEEFIANPDEKDDKGHYIKVMAEPNGTLTVLNTRNGEKKVYKK
jgi:beta-lactamase superfamily II metal-dependent hydrolase